jgi:hypothetical protein
MEEISVNKARANLQQLAMDMLNTLNIEEPLLADSYKEEQVIVIRAFMSSIRKYATEVFDSACSGQWGYPDWDMGCLNKLMFALEEVVELKGALLRMMANFKFMITPKTVPACEDNVDGGVCGVSIE